MITKLIALCTAAVLGGLWWEVGSDFGLAFNLGVRPIALAGIVAILWAPSQVRTRLVLLLAAVVLSNIVANLTYAQTEPWYVTSDSETQLWIVISVVIQTGVSSVALLGIGRMRRNRMPIGIETPLAGRTSLTTVRTDRVYGGSAGEVGAASQGTSQTRR